jgi:hypothetical protein
MSDPNFLLIGSQLIWPIIVAVRVAVTDAVVVRPIPLQRAS